MYRSLALLPVVADVVVVVVVVIVVAAAVLCTSCNYSSTQQIHVKFVVVEQVYRFRMTGVREKHL
jgi:hypothetical protein